MASLTMVGFRRYAVLALLLVTSVATGVVLNQSYSEESRFNPLRLVQRPTSVQTRDDAALLSGWLDKVDNGWEVGKNHQQVKSAFTELVSDARESTVRVFHEGKQVAMGTVVDASGLILTKASELSGDGRVTCQFADRRRRTGKVVAINERLDLAILRVRASDLVAVRWHSGEPPSVGSLLATPSLGRDPLAIGVVSLAPQAVENDGVLGIRLGNGRAGPVITEVIEDSAAEQAGLTHGDIVLEVDQRSVANSDELVELIATRLPGDEVQLRVKRRDEEFALKAILGRRTDLDLENSDFQSFLGGELSLRRTGFPQVLQHDTFLLPQHCGGPVVDLEGRVVGINIARAERIASYALPAEEIVSWIDEFRRTSQKTVAQTRL